MSRSDCPFYRAKSGIESELLPEGKELNLVSRDQIKNLMADLRSGEAALDIEKRPHRFAVSEILIEDFFADLPDAQDLLLIFSKHSSLNPDQKFYAAGQSDVFSEVFVFFQKILADWLASSDRFEDPNMCLIREKYQENIKIWKDSRQKNLNSIDRGLGTGLTVLFRLSNVIAEVLKRDTGKNPRQSEVFEILENSKITMRQMASLYITTFLVFEQVLAKPLDEMAEDYLPLSAYDPKYFDVDNGVLVIRDKSILESIAKDGVPQQNKDFLADEKNKLELVCCPGRLVIPYLLDFFKLAAEEYDVTFYGPSIEAGFNIDNY